MVIELIQTQALCRCTLNWVINNNIIGYGFLHAEVYLYEINLPCSRYSNRNKFLLLAEGEETEERREFLEQEAAEKRAQG